ncbi:glycosyltransferase, partial [Thioclava sp. BHET1]
MRAPISVVMATLNAEVVLPAQLLALGEGHDEGLIYEIIMVDGGSSDLSRMIAAEAGAEIVRGPREAEAALRLGARMAR